VPSRVARRRVGADHRPGLRLLRPGRAVGPAAGDRWRNRWHHVDGGEVARAPLGTAKLDHALVPWHFLNFFPLPHQHGSFRPSFGALFTIGAVGAAEPWWCTSPLRAALTNSSAVPSSACRSSK